MLKLWLLQRTQRPMHDEARGFVVCAPSMPRARMLAGDHAGDEGTHTWHSDTLSTCVEIGTSADNVALEHVVLCDFLHG